MTPHKNTLLVADDDAQILRLLTRSLEIGGFHVLAARDGEEALAMIEAQVPDLVLLDVMMPRMDGFTVCQKVRTFSAVPIIIITARGQDQEKMKGFDLGADDYITKPFNIDEVIARVRAVLRRAQLSPEEPFHGPRTVTTIGDLTLDEAQKLVTNKGEEVVLTPTEYRLLAYLMHNAGRILTHELLLDHVWGQDYGGESHLLQVNINRLRRKIEPDPAHPCYILTRLGIGYQCAAQPRR